MPAINRRDFLKLSISAAAASALAACGIAPASTASTLEAGAEYAGTETTAQVVVIGAGAAGLSAAHRLKTAGMSVIVLEARNRLGGRIHTDRSLGLPLDLGASWIHGTTNNPIAALAKTAGLKTMPTNYDALWRYDVDGRELTDAQDGKVDANFEAMMAKVYRQQDNLDADIPLQKAIENALAGQSLSAFEKRAINYAINSEIEHEYGADVSDLSLFWWDQEGGFSGADVLFPNGYDGIITHLAKGLDVRKNTVVSAIDFSASPVKVATNQGVFSAPRVVITLPLGVLKSGKITFTPSLPQTQRQAIARLKMGVLNKAYLQFPSTFWETTPHLLGYLAEQKGQWAEWLNLHKYTSQPVLLGFNAGAYGLALEKLSDAEIVAAGMAVLKKMYGNGIPAPVGRLITRWGADPYALGAYSHIPPGASGADYEAFASPAQKRLFFAGEHTHREHPATVHGAYLSGQRAAGQVLAL